MQLQKIALPEEILRVSQRRFKMRRIMSMRGMQELFIGKIGEIEV
jgi:hypothetical protein